MNDHNSAIYAQYRFCSIFVIMSGQPDNCTSVWFLIVCLCTQETELYKEDVWVTGSTSTLFKAKLDYLNSMFV